MIRVAINGFGRIGRNTLRAAVGHSQYGKTFEIVAVNDLGNTQTLAHLLKYDSIYGKFQGTITPHDDGIEVNGKFIKFYSQVNPSKLPWKDIDINVVVESTGIFRTRESASQHLEAGAQKVIISAPAKDPDFTVVLGVNEQQYDPEKHNIISNASCTTNSLAPPVKVLHDNFGIEQGFMTTIHSYTGDLLKQEVSKEEVNNALKHASETRLKGIMQYTEEPLVSIDIVGNPHSAIIDGLSTKINGERGNLVKILSWYDNEWGYSCRIVDLINYLYSNQKKTDEIPVTQTA